MNIKECVISPLYGKDESKTIHFYCDFCGKEMQYGEKRECSAEREKCKKDCFRIRNLFTKKILCVGKFPLQRGDYVPLRFERLQCKNCGKMMSTHTYEEVFFIDCECGYRSVGKVQQTKSREEV